MLFLRYASRSLKTRGRANAVTLLSLALFVAGGTLGLSFYLGLRQITLNAAPPENILVLAKGATAESNSVLDEDTVHRLSTHEGLRMDGSTPLVARENVTWIFVDMVEHSATTFPKGALLRGIEDTSLRVHQAKIVQGVAPGPHTLEALVGRRAAENFPQLTLGATFHLPGGESKVVGIFTANGGPLESEIWTPKSAVDLHTKKTSINVVTLVADDAAHVPAIIDDINASKDVKARAVSYATKWADEAGLQKIAQIVLVLLILLSVVAAIAIAVTMNAAVAVRVPELAALAALGIRKGMLARVIVLESALLGAASAVTGLLAAELVGKLLGKVPFSASSVSIVPSISTALIGAALGLLVALIGSFVPSWRVRTLDVLTSIR